MKFNPKDYDDRAVMVLSSESQAAVFGEFLDSLGFHWCSGDSYISRHPVFDDDQTYYRFKSGTRGRLKNADRSYTIPLYFDDFDWTDEPEFAISIDEVL